MTGTFNSLEAYNGAFLLLNRVALLMPSTATSGPSDRFSLIHTALI